MSACMCMQVGLDLGTCTQRINATETQSNLLHFLIHFFTTLASIFPYTYGKASGFSPYI